MISGTLEIILYVNDQKRSRDFYAALLDQKPALDAEGMTEFFLNSQTKLGLMPEKGIAKILVPHLPDPASGNGVPRCELYIFTDSPEDYLKRAIELGGILISKAEPRDWGDTVAYCADPDGHVIAFAKSKDIIS